MIGGLIALFIYLMGLISHKPCGVVLPLRNQGLSCTGPEKPRVQPPTADEETEVCEVQSALRFVLMTEVFVATHRIAL